jgi:hypothetical protein
VSLQCTMTRFHAPTIVLYALLIVVSCEAFSVKPNRTKRPTSVQQLTTTTLLVGGKNYFDNDEEKDTERELAKVRRGGRKRNDEYEDEYEPELYRKVDAYLTDKKEEDERDDYSRNGVIPNALLDSMDPEGAGERFPKLIRDPKFWIDIGLFFLLLNVLDNVAVIDSSPFGMGV